MTEKVPRGRPPFAASQRQEILRLLREAGATGVSRAELIFTRQLAWRGRPPCAASQRQEILRLLREAGATGVSRAEVIFTRHMTQCGTRIFELQKMGYIVRSENRGGRYPTWYVLASEPSDPRPLPSFERKQESVSGDWFERTTGFTRPKQAPGYGPLFSGVADKFPR
jgi:hypothetical protein